MSQLPQTEQLFNIDIPVSEPLVSRDTESAMLAYAEKALADPEINRDLVRNTERLNMSEGTRHEVFTQALASAQDVIEHGYITDMRSGLNPKQTEDINNRFLFAFSSMVPRSVAEVVANSTGPFPQEVVTDHPGALVGAVFVDEGNNNYLERIATACDDLVELQASILEARGQTPNLETVSSDADAQIGLAKGLKVAGALLHAYGSSVASRAAKAGTPESEFSPNRHLAKGRELLAYAAALDEDAKRVAETRKLAVENPLAAYFNAQQWAESQQYKTDTIRDPEDLYTLHGVEKEADDDAFKAMPKDETLAWESKPADMDETEPRYPNDPPISKQKIPDWLK